MTDKQFTERAFCVMFLLAFLYMGALSAALEGWRMMYLICGITGLAVMIAAAVACLIHAFTPKTED